MTVGRKSLSDMQSDTRGCACDEHTRNFTRRRVAHRSSPVAPPAADACAAARARRPGNSDGSPVASYSAELTWLCRASPSASRGARSPLLYPRPSRTIVRSEEHTSELQSLMLISYAVFCLKTKTLHFSDQIITNI